jgi:carbon-monoxide dehydrogenase small subunit
MNLGFILNGRDTVIDVPADRRVVDVLREDLGLTGTKEGCSSGECAACSILVDGAHKLSCLMLAAQLEGREVVTIEGLCAKDGLSRIQKAFVDNGAVQCGFCTPGMIIAAQALLRRNPEPSREDIRQGLSGNLCRCTGYVKIVDSIQAVSKQQKKGQ